MNQGVLGWPGETPGLPAGLIVMWSGTLAAIPAGWALCDGSNGTPNLLGMFIIGVATSGTNPGTTGGSSTGTPSGTNSAPTFTGSAMNTHSHAVGSYATADESSHTHGPGTLTTGNNSNNSQACQDNPALFVASQPHTHDVTGGATGSGSAHSHTVTGTSDATSAGTPAGTVSAPTFSGDAMSVLPPFYALAYIIKVSGG